MASDKKKLKIAIFDLTDCEGCELTFINLRERLARVAEQADFANWRLASDNHNPGPFDVTFIEGTPITAADVEEIKQARKVSKLVVALGACADLGGIQGSLGASGWKKGIGKTYTREYSTTSKPPKPLSYYIDIDYRLPGCPISEKELESFLGALMVGKKPTDVRYPVCLECKAAENDCLLLEGQPCLGPVTRGGCGAVCTSGGLRCWGCFGALAGGNQKALKKMLEAKVGKERTEQLFQSFMSHQDEFKEMYPKEN